MKIGDELIPKNKDMLKYDRIIFHIHLLPQVCQRNVYGRKKEKVRKTTYYKTFYWTLESLTLTNPVSHIKLQLSSITKENW